MLFTSEVLTPSSTPITHTAQRLPHAIARTPVRFGSPRSFRAHAQHSALRSRPCEAVLSCVSRLRWSKLRWFPLAATPKPELNRIPNARASSSGTAATCMLPAGMYEWQRASIHAGGSKHGVRKRPQSA